MQDQSFVSQMSSLQLLDEMSWIYCHGLLISLEDKDGKGVGNLVDPIVFADGVHDRLADGEVDGVDVGVYLPVC
jgi:hypothetical protein